MKVRKLNVCQECRSRKLGCDGRHPSCSQCLLRDRECSGYPPDFIFIPPQISSPSTAESDPPESYKTKQEKVKKQTRVIIPHRSTHTVAWPLSWPLCDVISLCAQNFVPANELPILSSEPARSQSRICGAWVEVLPDLAGRKGNEYLHSAIRAFGVSILARGFGSCVPISDVLEAQCTALHALQKFIQHNSTSSFNEIAAAIMCLFLSEMLLPTASLSSVVHARGIAELIQLRQPGFYSAGVQHKLFVGFRPMLILYAFLTRRSTFLAADKWKADPFRYIPASPLQVLLGETSEIPSILEDLDSCTSSADHASTVVPKAITRFVRVLDRLTSWYEENVSTSHEALWWTILGEDNETYLWFPSIYAANFLTHYWAFWVLCVTSIRSLRAGHHDLVEGPIKVDGHSLESEYISQKVTERSLWILQSIEFLTQEEMKLYGVASVFLPLQIACSVLGVVEERAIARHYGTYEKFIEKVNLSRYRDILLTQYAPLDCPMI